MSWTPSLGFYTRIDLKYPRRLKVQQIVQAVDMSLIFVVTILNNYFSTRGISVL